MYGVHSPVWCSLSWWHAAPACVILGRDSLARFMGVPLEPVELAEEDALSARVVGVGLVPGVVHGRVPGADAGSRGVARVRGGLRTATTCVSCARTPARVKGASSGMTREGRGGGVDGGDGANAVGRSGEVVGRDRVGEAIGGEAVWGAAVGTRTGTLHLLQPLG